MNEKEKATARKDDVSMSIDFSSDRLLSIASDCLDDHDYIGALKMLNKNSVSNGNDADSYMLYAETFDDMGLCGKCINDWFKYLDYAGENADFEEAYEGIAVSYMNMGDDTFAAYYYEKLLEHTSVPVSPEARKEIITKFLERGKTTLKFAYPPRIADYTEELDAGLRLMRKNDYEGAIKEFSKIEKKNPLYVEARNYIALSYVLSNEDDKAEKECEELLSINADDVQSLTTYATIKSRRGDEKGMRAIAERLKGLENDRSEDMFKTATVYSECGMHEEAYDLFGRLEEKFPYDSTLLYFRAIAAFNCGKDKECLALFDDLLTVYPNAVVADYWRYEAKRMMTDKRRKRKTLSYAYRLPARAKEESLDALSEYLRMNAKERKSFAEEVNIYSDIHWCFDECEDSPSPDLMTIGMLAAVQAGYEDFLRDVLLDIRVPDLIKLETVAALCESSQEGRMGVVINNELKFITFIPLEVESTKRSVFLGAYSLAFSHFTLFNGGYAKALNDAATKLYYRLKEEGRLSSVNDRCALAAAIYKSCRMQEQDLSDDMLYAFFDTTKKRVAKILGEQK